MGVLRVIFNGTSFVHVFREPLTNPEVPRHTAGMVPDNLSHFLYPWRSAEIVPDNLSHFLHPWRSAEIVPDNLSHFLHPWRSDLSLFLTNDKLLKMKNKSKSPL
jgi:hypothetical protein